MCLGRFIIHNHLRIEGDRFSEVQVAWLVQPLGSGLSFSIENVLRNHTCTIHIENLYYLIVTFRQMKKLEETLAGLMRRSSGIVTHSRLQWLNDLSKVFVRLGNYCAFGHTWMERFSKLEAHENICENESSSNSTSTGQWSHAEIIMWSLPPWLRSGFWGFRWITSCWVVNKQFHTVGMPYSHQSITRKIKNQSLYYI